MASPWRVFCQFLARFQRCRRLERSISCVGAAESGRWTMSDRVRRIQPSPPRVSGPMCRDMTGIRALFGCWAEAWDYERTDGRADGRTDRRADGRTDRRTDGWTDGRTRMNDHGRKDKRVMCGFYGAYSRDVNTPPLGTDIRKSEPSIRPIMSDCVALRPFRALSSVAPDRSQPACTVAALEGHWRG